MTANLYDGYIIVTVDEKDVSTPDKGIRVCEKVQHTITEFVAFLEVAKPQQAELNKARKLTQERMNALCKD